MMNPPALLGALANRPPPSSQLTPPESPDLAEMPGWGTAPAAPPSQRNPDPPSPDLTSSPAGAGDGQASPPISTPEFFKSRSKAYAAIAGAVLQAAGGWINHAAAVHAGDESFLPDDDDMSDIPPPLGRIAARRMKLGAIENLSDIEDIGMAVVGVTAWLAKGFASAFAQRRDVRRLMAEQAAADHEQATAP